MRGVIKIKKILLVVLSVAITISIFYLPLKEFIAFNFSDAAVHIPDEPGGGSGSSGTLPTDGYIFDDQGYDENTYEDTGLYPEDKEYKNNSKFYITEEGLGEFSTTVDHGCLFENKFVYLLSDIDWDYEWYPIGSNCRNASYEIVGFFKGTFDGKGHTISGLDIQAVRYDRVNHSFISGFFFKLGGSAKVYNLHLKNVTCQLANSDDFDNLNYAYAGAITGAIDTKSNASIEKCMVSNMKVKHTDRKMQIFAGGFVGMLEQSDNAADPTELSMTNCYLDGMEYTEEKVPNAVSLASLASYYEFNGSIKFECSVVKNCEYPFSNMSEYESLSCYSNEGEIDGLEESGTIIHRGGENVSTWYYAKDYNDDFPILRQFIKDWRDITFIGEDISFSPTKITVPKNNTDKVYSSTSNRITIFNQEVIATSLYLCEHSTFRWENIDKSTYKCSATSTQRNITIITKYPSETSKIETIITVNCGSSITIDSISWGKSSTIKSYTINGYKYEASDMYHLTVDCAHGTTIHEDTEITITLNLKSYNVQIE